MTAFDRLLVFSHPRCPHSKALIRDFRSRGVVFREIDLDAEPAQLEHLRSVCWEHRLPVVLDHERISIGFQGGSSTFDELGLVDRGG